MAVQARKKGLKSMIVPADNSPEAAVVEGIDVYAFEHLSQVMEWLRGEGNHEPLNVDVDAMFRQNGRHEVLDFSYVRGQVYEQRDLEVSAAVWLHVVII